MVIRPIRSSDDLLVKQWRCGGRYWVMTDASLLPRRGDDVPDQQRPVQGPGDPLRLTFGRVPRRTLAEAIAQRLLEAVRNQPPGTRMPSERALAEQLDVGRSTVREALNALATLGVLDIRHGRGVFVASSEPGQWGGDAIVPALIRAETNALLEARLVVQPEVARLAAERRTSADVVALQQVLDAQRRLTEQADTDGATRHGAEFDIRLAEAARNDVLAGMIRSLFRRMLERAPRLYELHDGFGTWDLAEHALIYEAVRDADGELAARRMRDHVLGIKQLYERYGAS
jgi:DNA-binding FadR family transcriptional regulator